VIGRAFAAAFTKDVRLLARDRVGLVFLTLAPIVVITVAGLSLATLYGAAPRGGSAPILPLVDDDGGWAGRAVRERLADEAAVRVRTVATAAAARDLVERKAVGGALVIPAGTSDALAAGRGASLELYTDPVRTVDVGILRALVQEVRHALERGAIDRAQEELDRARTDAEDAQAHIVIRLRELRERLARLREQLAAARTRVATAEHETRTRAAAAARARLATELAPLRAFLADLDDRRAAFDAWLAAVRKQAGRFADRVPPPPEPPRVPLAVAELATLDPDALAARLLPADGTVPRPGIPSLPTLPALELPTMPELPAARLPGRLDIVETSVTGAPVRFNTFDQNVPGFGVTFLLLGVLLGVSLGLLHEREWGTLERICTTAAPLSAVVLGKLAARFVVGMAQMALLFAVGRIAFGVSLGPEPWALALPTTGIVFAATAFGLIAAGATRSREAVLPLGAIVILTMAAVGGCWWPIDLEPEWMRRVALAFPTTWVMEAYNDLMIRRRTAVQILPATGVLLAYGAGYLVLGLALFGRRAVR